jgi:bifunctional non-homologous end joining protein LigD
MPEIIAKVKLSHPDKLYFPQAKISKSDLAEYYHHYINWILPHVKNRPLSILRCPEGIKGECFYQKHIESLPATIGQVKVKEQNATGQHLVIKNEQSLITLVQYGALELHAWGALADDIDTPDRMVFDLDPGPGTDFAKVIACARALHHKLEALSLKSFVKTSGKKGLHVFVPLKRVHTWDEVKNFAHTLAQELEKRTPKNYITTINKAKRRGKILIDYLRNERGATTVAAYSTRATPTASISTPLAWDELAKLKSAGAFDFKKKTK